MNDQSAWRLAVARTIAAIYAEVAEVDAILVGGSVARGCADRFSDVEIGVFWRTLPPAVVHEALMRQAGGGAWELDFFDPATEAVQYEEYAVDGLKIDLRHSTSDNTERALTALIEGTGSGDEEIAFVVRHGIPLFGDARLDLWREFAGQYSDARARAVAARVLDLPPWYSVPMYAQRGDLPLFYQTLSSAAQAVAAGLCALNREWYPGLKWVFQTLETLPIQPPETADRLRGTFAAEPAAAAEAMRQLIEETFDLAERTLPGLTLSRQRADFHYERPPIEGPGRGPLRHRAAGR